MRLSEARTAKHHARSGRRRVFNRRRASRLASSIGSEVMRGPTTAHAERMAEEMSSTRYCKVNVRDCQDAIRPDPVSIHERERYLSDGALNGRVVRSTDRSREQHDRPSSFVVADVIEGLVVVFASCSEFHS